MSKTNKFPGVVTVETFGKTTWSAEEYRSVPVFGRGSHTKRCAVKDDAGKPAMRAARELVIRIVCADGIVYRFDHDADGALTPESASARIAVHGRLLRLDSWQDKGLPPEVKRAHHLACRRLNILAARLGVSSLPRFRPLAKAVAA